MDINYLGHSSFKIVASSSPGGIKQKVTIVCDPFDPSMVGLKFPPTEADIVTVSHEHNDHGFVEKVKSYKKVVTGPGEYEIAGISIFGYPSFHDDKKGEERGKNTIYAIESDGLRIVHLGDLGHTLSEKMVEELGAVDVLMVPVGGFYTIGPKEAAETVSKIDPYFIVPMHYKVPGLSLSQAEKLSPVEDFTKEMGLPVETVSKFTIKKEDINDDQSTKIIVFNS